jgi:predicted transcriptional regulator
MTITLSPETQRLLEKGMRETGLSTPDELVRVALQALRHVTGEDFESLDPQTRAAVEEGLAQADRGETTPWEEAREDLRKRFIDS